MLFRNVLPDKLRSTEECANAPPEDAENNDFDMFGGGEYIKHSSENSRGLWKRAQNYSNPAWPH